tara:strand:+ start:437 stop:664 length:228 start_codon:yes stop_codon:yes gene_type:complete
MSDDWKLYPEEELRSECCGTEVREDYLCGCCYEEANYVVWWRYEMNKIDPIYSYAPTQKQIGKWLRKICNLDQLK